MEECSVSASKGPFGFYTTARCNNHHVIVLIVLFYSSPFFSTLNMFFYERYKSAKHNEESQNWVMEVKSGEDSFENPFQKLKAEKKLEQAKQK